MKKFLIKLIATPFILIGIVLGIFYTMVDFTWFIAKEAHNDITNFINKNNE